MKEYEFTLILKGTHDIDEEETNRIFEAGLDDASPGVRDGVAFIEVCRESESLESAILSAIVETKVAGFEVARVEPDDWVYLSDIARRLKRTRESVRLLVKGDRGPGGFPPPTSGIARRTRLWSWEAVRTWCITHSYLVDSANEDSGVIEAINGTLALLRHPRPLQLFKSIQSSQTLDLHSARDV